MVVPGTVTSEVNIYPKVWVKAPVYCEMAGEKIDAVRSRLRRGVWVEGKHTIVKDGHLYVNMPEADKWVERNP